MREQLKKNKALFVLPLALLPFVVLVFYVLDGGTATREEEQRQMRGLTNSGANYIIPEAEKYIEIYDKLEAYQQQGIGEEKRTIVRVDTIDDNKTDSINSGNVRLPLLADQNHHLPEDLLAHIKQKEKLVQAELNEETIKHPKQKVIAQKRNTVQKKDVVKKDSTQPKTGIEELDKIFDENIALNRKNDSLQFSLQQARQQLLLIEANRNNGFELKKQTASGFDKSDNQSSLIRAEIYETATVLNGNRVKLRLLEDTRINGKVIKQNTFIYGNCKIKNERLLIFIDQLPTGNEFVPVKLSIYDLDGMEGLYVPDNVARKVYQEVGPATNTSSMMRVQNDPLAYAGIRAADRTAQTLLKRIRFKKVNVKKNTLVYLINQK